MTTQHSTIAKIASGADLQALRDRFFDLKKSLTSDGKFEIRLCAGGGCLASGSLKLRDALKSHIEVAGLQSRVTITETGCLGPCAKGPVIMIMPGEVLYQELKPEDAEEIVKSHLAKGQVVERLTEAGKQQHETGEEQSEPADKPNFFSRQQKIVLHNCGVIDPRNIEEYIGRDGYAALAKALTAMTPEHVIEEMKASGLRGRGGAGFPTAMKWGFTRQEKSDVKYILCNADEGDPGAFMDRSILEGDPHSVIEGMAVGAYAIGASQGYVYVRAEYPLAVERLQRAIEQARSSGLLGKNILSTPFCFDLEIRMGSGAFVCGEETALITSIEGNRGEPRPRPPFPAQKGLWGKPTVLNNVETYANVATIIRDGGAAFSRIGTALSKGTKVFALAGAIENAGLVEVPVGTPLGELIYDIGGGIPNNREFKAAQVGGPSGGCVPRQHLNVPLDYESLNQLGAIMGSGGLIVLDSNACMVDVARYFLEFVQEESCGKCVPCREGTLRMLEILNRICEGKGEPSDIEKLETIGMQIKDTALCGLGQTAPNPVLSTIRHFRHEYEAHILRKQCDAGVCAKLVRAPCQSGCPAQVDVPGYISLVGEKRFDEALLLHRQRNPFASVCARVCFHPCESKCRRTTIDSPVSIRGVKRFMVEQEKELVVPQKMENAVNAAHRIAIIGAGPAGLSCGYFLARLGYKPVIFEAEEKAGGMLVQTIPAYRLPRQHVEKEIAMITGLGVSLKTRQRLGRDFTLESLRAEGYEAIFMGVGAPQGARLAIKGAEGEGVVDAIEFLRQFNLTGTPKVGTKVVVVGGGNAGIDAARTAIRLGGQVTIVYRRTRSEMPAWQ
ncbi:MAG: FAD-dependent oxidoreductase, partial [Chitinivibrionales bacterium]|nr:FAD-dependent oxidoreductase [Chitinivibrionales bacterium]